MRILASSQRPGALRHGKCYTSWLAESQARRGVADIAITRTGKTVLRHGAGGRSSVSGYTATVFGATGFLGRYLVNRLVRQGTTVVIPYREEASKRHLKVSADLGQMTFLEMDLRNQQSIEESVRHSDIVYSLIGRDYETKNFTYRDVHVEGTRAIAEAVAKYDVDRFVCVSSFNADQPSSSKFFATKGEGEEVARSIFPETTIVRPSLMYGSEDRFLNRLANVANLIRVNHNRETMYPVHVLDVGRALEHMMFDDTTAAQTFELYGPDKYSASQIADLIGKVTKREHRRFNIPKQLMLPVAKALGLLWWPTISPDEIERQFIDQHIDRTAKDFSSLGMEASKFLDVAPRYLRRYRSTSYYDAPPDTEKEKRELAQQVHVVD